MDARVQNCLIGASVIKKAILTRLGGKVTLVFKDSSVSSVNFASFLQSAITATVISFLQKKLLDRNWVLNRMLPVYLSTFNQKNFGPLASVSEELSGNFDGDDVLFLDETKLPELGNSLVMIAQSSDHGKTFTLKSVQKNVVISIPYPNAFGLIKEVTLSFYEDCEEGVNCDSDLKMATLFHAVITSMIREESENVS